MLKVQQIVAAVVTSAFVPGAVLAEWTQFQGNASHTGYAAGNYDAAGFRQLWHAPLEDAIDVAIKGDAVYVTQAPLGSSQPDTVSRLDRSNGVAAWATDLPSNTHRGTTAPTISGGMVYVHRFGHTGSSGSTEPEDFPALVGLDATNGIQQFATLHEGQWSSGSRPTVEGNAVFAAGGYYGGFDAYELNGSHRWFTKVNQQYGWVPAADGNNAYVYMGWGASSPGPEVGTFFILDRATGSLSEIAHPRSTSSFSGTDWGSVMLDGLGNAYALSRVSGGQTIVSFDLAGGDINWESDGAWWGNVAMNAGVIAVPEDRSAVFLDAATGDRLWSWSHSRDVEGNILLTDDFAFVNTDNGVHAIDLDTHLSVWNTPVQGELAADDGVLYVTNFDGVYAYAVPEPSAALSLALAAVTAGIACAVRRRRRP